MDKDLYDYHNRYVYSDVVDDRYEIIELSEKGALDIEGKVDSLRCIKLMDEAYKNGYVEGREDERHHRPGIIYAFCWKENSDSNNVINLFYHKKDAQDMVDSFGYRSDNYCVVEFEITK